MTNKTRLAQAIGSSAFLHALLLIAPHQAIMTTATAVDNNFDVRVNNTRPSVPNTSSPRISGEKKLQTPLAAISTGKAGLTPEVAPPKPAAEANNSAAPQLTAVAGESAQLIASAAPAPLPAPMIGANYLHNPPPVYPNFARQAGIEGSVQLRVLVSSAGSVLDILLAKSSGHASLDNAAIDAVKKWQFTPAHQGQMAQESWVLVPVKFSLGGS